MIMKSIKYLFSAAILLFLAACSNSGDELLRVIPEHPSMVVKINMASICQSNNLLSDDGNITIPSRLNEVLGEYGNSFSSRVIKSLSLIHI